MDKYEYKLKTEQMLELMEDGAYNQAAEIADTIDWKRVRNTTMLGTVSEIYEKNRDFQKSYEVLRIAYSRAEGSRKIISRLCTLALKTRNVDEAIDFYDDFIEIAPKDPNQYILKYQILRAQKAPIEQQIHALEEFKKAEYIEEWAYELAKLYQEAGMTAECLEECDDLILWFSEGKYVYQAMELKMQHKPLTPSQQEKYDRRYEKVSSETEEIPDLTEYKKSEEPPAEQVEEEIQDKIAETEEKIQETVKKKLGNTMKLDEALKSLLNIKLKGDEPEEEKEPEEEEDLTELESEIEEIEAVADLGLAKKVAEEKRLEEIVLDPDLEELRPEPEPEEDEISEEVSEEDTAPESKEASETETDAKSGEAIASENVPDGDAALADEAQPDEAILKKAEEVREEDDQIQGQMNLMDILGGWGEAEELSEEFLEDDEAEEFDEGEELPEEFLEDVEAEEFDEGEELPEEFLEDAEAEEFDEGEDLPEEFLEDDEAEEFDEGEELPEEFLEDDEAEEFDEGEELPEEFLEVGEAEEIDAFLEDLEGEIQTEDADVSVEALVEQTAAASEKEGAMEEKKKEATPILSPDIQRLIDEIEGNIPPQEETAAGVDYDMDYEADDEPGENMGAVAEELRVDEDSEEFEDYDDILDEEEYAEPYEDDYEEEYTDAYADEEEAEYDDADLTDEEETFGDLYGEDADEYTDEYEEEVIEAAKDYEEDYSDYEEGFEDDWDSVAESFEEEFRPRQEYGEVDDREIPDEEEEIDLLSATTPLSRKETAKLIATGKTSPLPLDEISDALSMSDTGFVVHGRYDLRTQSGIGTRAGLTDEQKKLFSYFVPVRGMSEQLVDVLEQDKNCTNRKGTSRTGNLLIIGNKGNGKTVLAVDVVKAIQKQRNIRQGKVAIVTGDSLNKKKISDIFSKLYGGALIIEKAGKMNEKTVARLNKAMEHDTGELLLVLEDQRKPLDRLLTSNREFRRKFTSRLEVPIFINDELVTFGQTYAQENGYRIDEMSILALYSRIDSLQREDHAVTITEVKEIMDEAMAHSQKASAKKLVKRVFGKNTDDDDRIILTEKDFNI